MNIKLNVKKETFIQYLLKLGYNYKINQYDDFIKRIGFIILNEVNIAMTENKLSIKINQIFSTKTDILILEDYLKIENINESYLTSLIENGLLDLYLEDKTFRVNPRIYNSLYIYRKIESLNFGRTLRTQLFQSIFQGKLKSNSSLKKSILKYEELNLTPLSDISKEMLDNEIISHFLLISREQWEMYILNTRLNLPLTSDDIILYINEYIQNNISLAKLTGRIDLVFRDTVGDVKKENIINSLFLRKKKILYSDKIISFNLVLKFFGREYIISSKEIEEWKKTQ